MNGTCQLGCDRITHLTHGNRSLITLRSDRGHARRLASLFAKISKMLKSTGGVVYEKV
jgi:hypothetical protein